MRTLSVLFFLGCVSLTVARAGAGEKPNVILILADDMATGDLSAFNGGITRTPNLDRLMREGIWFENAFSGSPVCAPSRAALLTGRYPHRTGVVSLDMNKEPELTRLLPDETILPQIFAANGWHTALVGKWHVGIGEGFGPIARGFHEFEGFHGSDRTAYFNYAIQTGDTMTEVKQARDKYLTDELSERAVAFVRRRAEAGTPFFLHLAHYAPHRPLQAPDEAVRPYRDAGFDDETATVYAMIEIMDRGIGNLLRELDTLGIRERTLVIFASDNGPDILVPERFNRGLRGGKYMVHEGGIRVPFILSWPGKARPGRRDDMIHFIDVLPTLVDLCGLKFEPARKLDGDSFAALVTGEGARPSPRRFWQWNRHQPNSTHNAALRNGPWKLVKPFVTKNKIVGDSDAPYALYHLEDDPAESNDLAAEHPDRVQSMSEALEAWSREVESERQRFEK